MLAEAMQGAADAASLIGGVGGIVGGGASAWLLLSFRHVLESLRSLRSDVQGLAVAEARIEEKIASMADSSNRHEARIYSLEHPTPCAADKIH